MKSLLLLVTMLLLNTKVYLPVMRSPDLAPKNIILVIGDGLGEQHVRAASYYQTGQPTGLSFQNFPHMAMMSTASTNYPNPTDSAAAATAMATGIGVANGVVSVDTGSGAPLETLIEYFHNRCKVAGLVTTTEITHATTASFGAHSELRFDQDDIATDFVARTKPELLLGGGWPTLTRARAESNGYTFAADRDEMNSVIDDGSAERLMGLFGDSHLAYEYDYMHGLDTTYDEYPHLTEMTSAALEFLEDNEHGMFLMIEGGHIDLASHDVDIARTVEEVLELEESVQLIIDWMQDNPDTLLLVTGDHETGGLQVTNGSSAGTYPQVSWSSGSHTNRDIPVYATGVNSDRVSGGFGIEYLNHIVKVGSTFIPDGCDPKNSLVAPDDGAVDAQEASSPMTQASIVSAQVIMGALTTVYLLKRIRNGKPESGAMHSQ